jgi:uncharacterized lipoprotein YmbA
VNRRIGVRAAIVVAVATVAACRSGPPPIREFMLSTSSIADAAKSAAGPDSSPGSKGSDGVGKLPAVRVTPLLPRAFLDRRGIAWREGDVRSGAYQYRRWSEAPADAVTRALVDTLRARGAFAQVDATGDAAARGVTLRGELLGLHESSDEKGEHPFGVAELELVVDAGATRTILHARHAVAAADESMEALVRAVSEALGQVLGDLAPQVEAAVSAAPR